VARDQDRGERLALLRRPRCVRTAPWKELEKNLVVAPVGETNRFTPLDRGGLAGQLRRILTLLDDDSSLEAGADVVTAAVLEGREQLVGRKQLDDARVLRLYRGHMLESLFLQDVAEVASCLGFDDELGDSRRARPVDEGVQRVRVRGHR